MSRRRSWVAGLALVASLAYVSPAQADEGPRPGRVANTDGANLRLRAAPDPDAPILKRLGPGWRLTVLGGPSADGHWLRVQHAGTTGFVAVGFVALEEGGDPAPAAAPAAPAHARRTGRVANTEGGTLRLRATADDEATVLKRLGPGWALSVLGEAGDGRWLRVEHGGTTGYVAAAYVSFADAPAAAATVASGGRSGWVSGTDGSNLNLRATPSAAAALVKKLGPGWRVTILEEPFTAADGAAWVRVEHGGVSGYALAAYVAGTAAGGGEAGVRPAVAASAPAAPAPSGDRLLVSEATRLRTSPDLSAAIIAPLPAGHAVERLGGERSADGFRWLRVRAYGREGWVVNDALTKPLPSEANRRLAGEALAQTGRPYVWGGEKPNPGFDCSGLVRYVVQRVTGIDVTHVLARQAEAGSPVDRDSLQVGDLVFFRDTYKPGLSHVGFYVGDGQFVGAQNERAGVSRAPLDSRYWGTRFYGARRLIE